MKRRDFLKAAATIPALACLRSNPAFAEEARHVPPYLALKKFIEPGNDEFVWEKTAEEIRRSLSNALLTKQLRISEPRLSGAVLQSPLPSHYRPIAPDIHEAVFDSANRDAAGGWKSWVESLGAIRRAEFYPLPDDIVRYEIASKRDGKLLHRVGHGKVSWEDGKLVSLKPLGEHLASADAPLFRDVTAAVFEKTPSFSEQLAKGIPYWRARLDPASGIDVYGSNGLAVGDIDGDGRPEIVLVNMNAYPSLLKNNGQHGHYLNLALTGTKSNRSAIGARAIVTAGTRKMIDEVMSGGSYYSQNSLTLHFGLGPCTEVSDVEIHWPSGIVQHTGKARADQTLKIVEKQ